MKIFAIGDEYTVLGLSLGGIRGKCVVTRKEALEALEHATSDPEIGIVLVSEDVAAMIREEIDAKLFGLRFPLVLEIPGIKGASAERLDIRQVIRKAVGISI